MVCFSEQFCSDSTIRMYNLPAPVLLTLPGCRRPRLFKPGGLFAMKNGCLAKVASHMVPSPPHRSGREAGSRRTPVTMGASLGKLCAEVRRHYGGHKVQFARWER